MSKYNMPHKANVGEIIRVRGYVGFLFLVTEWSEEVMHEPEGITECVTYTVQNIDNYKDIKIVFDDDVESIVVTADKSDDFIAKRQKGAQPPAVQQDNTFKIGDMTVDLGKIFREQAEREKANAPKTDNNAPRSQWQKEREEKRKAYEYVDFLLERYNDLVSMQAVMPHDKELQSEIDIVKAEFMEKTGMKVIQDGKFS